MKSILRKVKKFLNRYLLNDDIFTNLMKDIGVLLSGDAVASIINFVNIAILVRVLGLELYGNFVIIQTYSLTIDKLLNFQSWQGVIKFGSEAISNNRKDLVKKYVKIGFITDISTAILGTLVAVFAVGITSQFLNLDPHIIPIAQLYSINILFNVIGTPTGILRLFNKFSVFSYQKVFVALLRLIIAIIAFILNINFIILILLTLIVEIIGHFILIYFSLKVLKVNGYGKWWKQKSWVDKEFTEFIFFSNITSGIDIPVKQLDVFIVQAVLTTELVGVYKVLKQIVSIFSKLLDPIYQAIFPPLANLCASKQYKEARKIIYKIGFIMFMVGSFVTILASLTSNFWLPMFFGEGLAAFGFALTIYLFIKVLSNTFVGLHPYFIAIGNIKLNVLVLLISNASYLLIAWNLGKEIGLLGIIVAYGAQSMIGVVLKIIILLHQNKYGGDSKFESIDYK